VPVKHDERTFTMKEVFQGYHIVEYQAMTEEHLSICVTPSMHSAIY